MSETLVTINRRLSDYYGKIENLSIYRVVWSEDEFELRKIYLTPEGFSLNSPKIERVPKYRSWINERHVLERLTVVPDVNQGELLSKLSYEPLWVFETSKGQILPLSWMAIEFIIRQVHKNMEGHGPHKEYKDPDAGLTTEQLIEKKRAELLQLQQELFPNETEVGDALAYREGITVPTNYIKRDDE